MSLKLKWAGAITGLLLLVLVPFIFIILVSPGRHDFSFELGNSCTLSRTSAYHVDLYCEAIEEYIPDNVVALNWTPDYVIAKTHPLRTDPKHPNCIDCFDDESVSYWWIVDLKNKQRIGPINTEQDFIARAESFGLEPKLLTVDEARNQPRQYPLSEGAARPQLINLPEEVVPPKYQQSEFGFLQTLQVQVCNGAFWSICPDGMEFYCPYEGPPECRPLQEEYSENTSSTL